MTCHSWVQYAARSIDYRVENVGYNGQHLYGPITATTAIFASMPARNSIVDSCSTNLVWSSDGSTSGTGS
jgi:hypothetical protein